MLNPFFSVVCPKIEGSGCSGNCVLTRGSAPRPGTLHPRGHFEDPHLFGLLRRTICTKISYVPTLAKLGLWASNRMVGGKSLSNHFMKNEIKPVWNTSFPYWGNFEDPNLLGLLRRTIWRKISCLPPIAKVGLWASKRMVGGESLSNQFGDIQKVRLRMKNTLKPIWNTSLPILGSF